jgi:Domain of Unknown Function (DUF1080)
MLANRRHCFAVLLAATFGITGCASLPGSGWTALIDGEKGIENFNRVGDANWRTERGAIVADNGKTSYLVTKNNYKDFEIRAEFWAETDTNSGIFIRAAEPDKIAATSAYEVNIWDIRPDPKYGSGAIVDFAAVPVPLPATHLVGGKWNVLEITARGSKMTVVLNGTKTVDLDNSKFASGPFALQYGTGVNGARGGVIKWRSVKVRSLN